MSLSRVVIRLSMLMLVASGLAAGTISTAQASPDGTELVISEFYTAGGNSGAVWTHDWLELHNPSQEPISLAGLSLQYAAAGNTGAPGSSQVFVLPDDEVPGGGHYLIQLQSGGGNGTALPVEADASYSSINMAIANGQIFLARVTTPLDPDGPGNDEFPVADLIDFVGYGSAARYEGSAAAPANSAASSLTRDAHGTDTDDNAADFRTTTEMTPTNSSGETLPAPAEPVQLTIAEIQGTGFTTPYLNQQVTTRGVVTAAYPTGGFFGFYLQTAGTGGPIDLAGHEASDGIFVYQNCDAGCFPVTVEPGDHVQVTGLASEYAGATQISVSAGQVSVLDEEAAAVLPAITATWPATAAEKESLEGMLVSPLGTFTVTETYLTQQFGELGLAVGEQPLIQPTEVARPGSAEAAAVAADNEARVIVLDDGSSANYMAQSFSAGTCMPRPVPCLVNGHLTPAWISTDQPVRVGAPVTFTEDVILTEGGSPSNPTYRFQPLRTVTGPDNSTAPITVADTRTDAPDQALIGAADLQVSAFNVLNYFPTLGESDPACAPYYDRAGNGSTVRTGCPQRGAWSAAQFERQQEKIVAAITAMDVDVLGLIEIENSARMGNPADQATEQLVAALNEAEGAGVWAAVPSSTELPDVGLQDVITNALIYKPAAVVPTGEPRALGDQSEPGQAFGNAREPIGQAFVPVGGGEPFFVVVNHFKSKGSPGPHPGDEDTGDGQGSSVASRMLQAEALRDWIPEVTAGVESVLLVGDFNSYTEEDPLQVLYDAGYVNATRHHQLEKYSYSFGGRSGSLDHVLMNQAAQQRSTGVDIWNINSGESVALEYSRHNYHATDFHRPDPFRSSDHDPIIVGLLAETTSAGCGRALGRPAHVSPPGQERCRGRRR
ncbi:ExeM/NucH family extracellular endonuclease [Nocardioides limicola]|uniref:ExeM/NucH family extracellular endonuclease n=1 Tax=Nocardioides limicola TaxID=2803368 RepID=UPI00193B96AD|nr:ExeM/NucH family extracellular endonuclease [Nocardioides sp. DJM-14]